MSRVYVMTIKIRPSSGVGAKKDRYRFPSVEK